MSLSEPSKRTPIHTRRVECHGYRREDGLWDIEGHLIDTKAYDFESSERGAVKAGVPVHEMRIRITVDNDMVIRETEAVTEFGPFGVCPKITPNYRRIKDIKIGPGFRARIAQAVGGINGCTHLSELLGPMATTAFQTIMPIKAKENAGSAKKNTSLIGTCHAYAPGSEIVRRLWPESSEAGV